LKEFLFEVIKNFIGASVGYLLITSLITLYGSKGFEFSSLLHPFSKWIWIFILTILITFFIRRSNRNQMSVK